VFAGALLIAGSVSTPAWGILERANYVLGALVIAVSIMAMAEVLRPLRWVNLALGIFALVLPLSMFSVGLPTHFSNFVLGGLLILLTFPPGVIRENYGTWNRFLKKTAA
jgi:hypothetical protein